MAASIENPPAHAATPPPRRQRRNSASLVGIVSGVAASGIAISAIALPAAATPLRRAPVHVSPTTYPELYGGHCFGVYPGQSSSKQLSYAAGCYGHDEPQLSPISSAAGSGQNITWTFVLPSDGTTTTKRKVLDNGPAFWLGALVNDPNSLANQAFDELQFYPDSVLTSPYCASDGSFYPKSAANKYTACAPAFAADPFLGTEYTAFNAMLTKGTTTSPLVMYAGDTIVAHYFPGTQSGTPLNIVVTDTTPGHTASGTIVVVGATDGPLAPAASTNTTNNYLQWGAVEAAPMSLSWEIGHPNFYTYPLAPACYPGMFNCFSYNVTKGWALISPIQVKSVTFNDGTVDPSSWGVVDGQGGSHEDTTYCGSYNHTGSAGACTFPWYTYNGTNAAIEFGSDYTGTTSDFGQDAQFDTTDGCGPGPYSQPLYCNTTLSPNPPIP